VTREIREFRAELRGLGVSPGLGFGVVRKLTEAAHVQPDEQHGGDAEAERCATAAALAQTAAELENRGERAGGTVAEILAAQALMVRDPALSADIDKRIGNGASAARAVNEAFGAFRELLAGAGEYLAGRVTDLDDLRDRVIAVLLGAPEAGLPVTHDGEPIVLVASDLAPADTALLDPEVVAGFVTENGGPTSHTAILARALGVPAVVACPDAGQIADGALVLIDGDDGTVMVDPPDAELARARAVAAPSPGSPPAPSPAGSGRTADGRPVALVANIGHPRDLAAALEAGAEGVGLYRTEFLFFDRTDEPSEDEQQAAYQQALEAFPGGTVVIRVLDVGADKPLRFVPSAAAEPNPALGERGLRMLRRDPGILDRQLRALASAAAAAGAAGGLGVMAPMVADVDDACWFVGRCRDHGIERAGIMIEVPSAALRAADLAGAAAFFSVGTNDLAQYTFAAERQSAALARHQDPWQPAVLDLIATAAAAAAADGKPCGVCGEAASDPALACVLAGLGVTSLSMTPRTLPRVRAALAGCTWAQCEAAAAAARSARTAPAARTAARAALPGLPGS
jgi:phosphoenolpyruvate-protein phosphotransferase (PTS system enzyme I)